MPKYKIKLPRLINSRDINKLYDYLLRSDVISFTEHLKSTNAPKTKFKILFHRSPKEVQNFLILLGEEGIDNANRLIEHPTDEGAILRPSKDQYRVGIKIDERAQTKLDIEFLKFDTRTGAPKWSSMTKRGLKFHIPSLGTTRYPKTKDYADEMVGALIDDLKVIEEAASRLLDFMYGVKGKIDAHVISSSGDKVLLWFATYQSSNTGEGFKGYVITGHKVLGTIQRKADVLVGVCETFLNKNGGVALVDSHRGEISEFIEMLNSIQYVEHPVGEKYPVNLGEIRRDIVDGDLNKANEALLPVFNIGHKYLNEFESLYKNVQTFVYKISRNRRKALKPLPKRGEHLAAKSLSSITF